jgi:hypothetical protein
VWYAKGIGIVQAVGFHHGTYWEDRTQLLSTTIAGVTRIYSLRPAKTIPLSEFDCNDSGWRHFVHPDGSTFSDEFECRAAVRKQFGSPKND